MALYSPSGSRAKTDTAVPTGTDEVFPIWDYNETYNIGASSGNKHGYSYEYSTGTGEYYYRWYIEGESSPIMQLKQGVGGGNAVLTVDSIVTLTNPSNDYYIADGAQNKDQPHYGIQSTDASGLFFGMWGNDDDNLDGASGATGPNLAFSTILYDSGLSPGWHETFMLMMTGSLVDGSETPLILYLSGSDGGGAEFTLEPSAAMSLRINADTITVGGVNVVTISGTQTLTNKTLTTPIISSISNTGTLTLPTSTDTLVGRATTDTLSNKTLSGATVSSGDLVLSDDGSTLLISPSGSQADSAAGVPTAVYQIWGMGDSYNLWSGGSETGFFWSGSGGARNYEWWFNGNREMYLDTTTNKLYVNGDEVAVVGAASNTKYLATYASAQDSEPHYGISPSVGEDFGMYGVNSESNIAGASSTIGGVLVFSALSDGVSLVASPMLYLTGSGGVDTTNVVRIFQDQAAGEITIGPKSGGTLIYEGTWQGDAISTTYTDAKVTSVAGTTNQINVSAGTGAVTISTPQDINTTANVDFATVTTTGDITVGDGILIDESEGIYFEEDGSGGHIHAITWNDGTGNFNIRVANIDIGGTPSTQVSTETGYAFHEEYGQSTGIWDFQITSASATVGDGLNGSWYSYMQFDADLSGQRIVVFNNSAHDIDFRVKGDTDSDLIRTDAANDVVGIGVNPSGTYKLEVNGGISANQYTGNGSSLTNLDADNVDAGTLAVARGGTGTSVAPTSGQVLIGTAGGGYTANGLTGGTNITVTNGSGTITINHDGFADTANVATTVTLVQTNSGTGPYYPLFTDAASGNENPRTDNGFTYNATDNALTATTFIGALSGNASTASTWATSRTNTVTLTGQVTGTGNASVNGGGNWTVSFASSLAAAAITGQTNMTGDVADADEMLISDGGVLKRIDFSVLRDAVFNDVSGDVTIAAGGDATVNVAASQISVTDTDANDTYYPMFADGTSGDVSVLVDASTLTYNASSDTLTVGTLSLTNALAVADGGTGATTLNNLITMGTHTTGNYVATITAGVGIDSTGATSGETINHTLSVDVSDFMTNGANNRVVTATGTDAMNAESGLTFDGTTLSTNRIAFTGQLYGDITANGTVASPWNLNWNNGNIQTFNNNGNKTVDVDNTGYNAGASYVLIITAVTGVSNGSGWTWNLNGVTSSIKWVNGSKPEFSTTVGDVTVVQFFSDSATTAIGSWYQASAL